LWKEWQRMAEVEVAMTLVVQPEWVRGPARVEGSEIVLDENRAEKYWLHEPGQVDKIAFDLAAMAPHGSGRDPRQAVAFVRRYGMLWHGANKLGSGSCRESLDRWWHEAEKLHTVLSMSMTLGEALRDDSAAPVREWFDARLGLSFEADEIYLAAATKIVAGMINRGLRNSKWGMASGGVGEIRLAHYPPDLVAAAYASLGGLIATRAEFKECPGCGRVFQPESGKQTYHDPQCATRSRQRRWKRGKSKQN
jgi:hypothetical protein